MQVMILQWNLLMWLKMWLNLIGLDDWETFGGD